MNKKIDDVLYSLLETKKFIVKKSLNNKSDISYDNTIKNLDNLIVDYTLNNKMSKKEILDTTFSLYDIEVKKGVSEKIKDFFNISKHIQNTKEKITENHKKKEIKKQCEEEIVNLVKEKLQVMIQEDKKNSSKDKDIEIEIENKTDKNIINDIKKTHIKNNNIINNKVIENEKGLRL